jgi:hypothetical protein
VLLQGQHAPSKIMHGPLIVNIRFLCSSKISKQDDHKLHPSLTYPITFPVDASDISTRKEQQLKHFANQQHPAKHLKFRLTCKTGLK